MVKNLEFFPLDFLILLILLVFASWIESKGGRGGNNF
jgi:hypothetical protein